MTKRAHARNLGLATRKSGGIARDSARMPAQVESNLVAVLDDLPLLVWRSGRDARCDYFNKAWFEFTGRALEQELGDGWAEGVHPEDRPRCVREYLRAFRARAPFELEYRLRRHDGEYRWIRDIGRPLFSGKGAFSGYVGGCLDISDRRNAEIALHAAQEERERLGQDLHDNIIQAIYAVGMLLEESQRLSGVRQKDAPALIARAIDRLNHVIGDVRCYIAGPGGASISTAGFQAELHKLVSAASETGTLRYRLDMDPRAIQQLTQTELSEVLQIAREGLSNSLRHSRGKCGLFALSRLRNGLRLVISDDGVGFGRENAKGKNRGLNNMRHRARQIGASIRVSSAPGRGTRIVVHIPRTQ